MTPFIFSSFDGKFKDVEGNTIVEVETKIQKALFRLYIFSVISIGIPVFLPCFITPDFLLSIAPFVQCPIFAFLFYLLFRGGYLLSRNQGIKTFERLLY